MYKPRYGLNHNQIFTLYENFWRKKGLREEGQWENLEAFLQWAAATGYRAQAHLRRIRTSLPYGPKNCYWEYPESVPAEYPEGHPCLFCPDEATCREPCGPRLAHWNESMDRLRPIFAAAAQGKE
ncbi:MAG: hypothetical protein ACI3W5_15680 [Faecousia sp.]